MLIFSHIEILLTKENLYILYEDLVYQTWILNLKISERQEKTLKQIEMGITNKMLAIKTNMNSCDLNPYNDF